MTRLSSALGPSICQGLVFTWFEVLSTHGISASASGGTPRATRSIGTFCIYVGALWGDSQRLDQEHTAGYGQTGAWRLGASLPTLVFKSPCDLHKIFGESVCDPQKQTLCPCLSHPWLCSRLCLFVAPSVQFIGREQVPSEAGD